LSDPDGNCLGFTDYDNYEDKYGQLHTRIQVVPCIMEIVDPTDEAELAELKKQLWSVELGASSDSLFYIRNVCTNDVIKKVKSLCSHDDLVYKGQKSCNEFHFDAELVDKSLCVEDHKFGVNDCLFNKNDKGTA
jgi:ethanolamine ammonia-lyase large subunit